jgi:hypothetical protein
VQQMAREFRELVRERQPEAFDRWLEAAKGSEVAGITTVWWTRFRYATSTSFIPRSS